MRELNIVLAEVIFDAKKHLCATPEGIKKIKQWAISRKPKEKEEGGINHSVDLIRNGYNRALADYVKNLEEK